MEWRWRATLFCLVLACGFVLAPPHRRQGTQFLTFRAFFNSIFRFNALRLSKYIRPFR